MFDIRRNQAKHTRTPAHTMVLERHTYNTVVISLYNYNSSSSTSSVMFLLHKNEHAASMFWAQHRDCFIIACSQQAAATHKAMFLNAVCPSLSQSLYCHFYSYLSGGGSRRHSGHWIFSSTPPLLDSTCQKTIKQDMRPDRGRHDVRPVSYTHLTLPTILRV